MTPTTTISRWVLLAQTGDPQALARLFHEVEEELLRLLCRMIGDTHEAEDLSQEVFLVIDRKLRWLRDPALFRTWAWRIATRAATRQILRRRLHWLILIAAGIVYITLSIGLIASGVRADANTQRLLNAIELLHERPDERTN